MLWRARSGSAAGSSSGGGWNSTSFNVVPTKMYRFSVWIRCFGANASGSFCLGVGGGTVSDIGGGVNSNPYFLANGRSLLPDSQWVVFDVDTGYNDYATITDLRRPAFIGKAKCTAGYAWWSSNPGSALFYRVGVDVAVYSTIDHYATGASEAIPGGRLYIRLLVPVPRDINANNYQIRIDAIEWSVLKVS